MNGSVSYILFEGELTRMERIIKRLWILAIVLVVLLVGTNFAWLAYESQFSTETSTTVSQNVEATDDGSAIVNGTGEININGKD